MMTSKNWGAFLVVALCSWRLAACSAKTADSGPGGAAAGFGTGAFAAAGPVGGATGAGGSFQSTGSTGDQGGSILSIGGNNIRVADAACHPVSEVPETIVVTDSTYQPVAMFVMQDRSSSMVMGGMGASAQSWDNSQMAMSAFVSDPASAGIDIGLGSFPVGQGNTFDCATGSDCGKPVVPIGKLTGSATTGNAPAIINAYQSQRPTGLAFTPTECALRGMINTCLQYMAQSPIGEKCVAVLVTDGTPTQCSLDEAALTAIIADGKANGVETFTLGLPGADLNVLNQYAMAGGSGQAIDVTSGSAAFVKALNDIRSTVLKKTEVQTPLKCQWKIPKPGMGDPVLDPTQVNVQFTPPGMPGVQFGHVKSPMECPPNGNAWYYDNEQAPTQIFLCPGTCAAADGVKGARIDILFHCPSKPYIVM